VNIKRASLAAVSKTVKRVTAAAKSDPKADRVLLPKDVVPSYYDLTIQTNMGGNWRYDGTVKIHVEVKNSVTSMMLHCKELHLEDVSFVADGKEKKPIVFTKVDYDVVWNTATIHFKEALPKGKGVVEVAYTGLHNNQMCGFYRSTSKDAEGNEVVTLCTQFESLDARRCFPCVDEPAMKAVFKPTLIVPDGLVALSNMPVESETLMDDGINRKFVFGETPKMSTYLLAFVVGDFEYVERTSDHGVLIRTYTPPGNKALGDFSVDVAVQALDLYDDLFKQPYPLPKLDMIGIADFAAGAMENWGLVTYRMVDVLIDSERASSQQKQRVAAVVAHELAHQWFGNLVTMEWWSGLWLNEGFASWMQQHCCAEIFPEWNMWEQFIIEAQAEALRLDALVSSHPIEVPIKHAEEVEDVFDGISYRKGASVVRLIHSFLGKKFFEEGLQVYMDRHKYANAETNDLWQAWEDVSKLPVKKVMASWTDQMGYPVVTINSMTWNADFSECELDLTQKWFIADGSEHPDSKSKLWSIPLMASMGGNDGELVNLGIMDTRTKKVTVKNASGEKTWIKLNGEQHVPMRVNYVNVASEIGSAFFDAIRNKEMVGEDRIGVLLDHFALAKAGLIDAGALMQLIAAYNEEDSFPVIAALESVLSSLNTVVRGNAELSAAFKAFCAELISKPCEAVGWEKRPEDGHLTNLMRTSLIRLQAKFRSSDPEVQRQATERFEAWSSDPIANDDQLPSDIRTSVISIVLASADDDAAYETCLDLIDQATSTQARKEIYLAIGATKSSDLKLRTLDWCTSGALKRQDFFYPINAISGGSQEGLELTWSYLQENFSRIVDYVRTASPSLTAALVNASCSGFTSEDKADEIEAFFKEHNEHPIPLIQRKIDQLVENTRANAKFLLAIESSETFAGALDTAALA